MKNPVRLREIIAWVLFIACAIFSFVKTNDSGKWHDEKIVAEEKIKFFEENARLYHSLADSFKLRVKIDSAVIEYQKNNPKIIERRYNEIRNGVLNLPVDDKIIYLSGRLSKKDNNR